MADKAPHPWRGPTTLMSAIPPLLAPTPAMWASLVFLEHGTAHLRASTTPAFSASHILPCRCLAHTSPSPRCLPQSLQTCPCLLTLLLPSLALWPCSRVCFSLRPLASFSRLYAFTCSGGRNKLPRDTEIYSLTALEARSPPSRCGQG